MTDQYWHRVRRFHLSFITERKTAQPTGRWRRRDPSRMYCAYEPIPLILLGRLLLQTEYTDFIIMPVLSTLKVDLLMLISQRIWRPHKNSRSKGYGFLSAHKWQIPRYLSFRFFEIFGTRSSPLTTYRAIISTDIPNRKNSCCGNISRLSHDHDDTALIEKLILVNLRLPNIRRRRRMARLSKARNKNVFFLFFFLSNKKRIHRRQYYSLMLSCWSSMIFESALLAPPRT